MRGRERVATVVSGEAAVGKDDVVELGVQGRDIVGARADGVHLALQALPTQAVAYQLDVVGIVLQVQDLQLHPEPPCDRGRTAE